MQANEFEQEGRPDPLRRRLARGGLAGTVVLGSMISNPVLGGPLPNCTPSGKLSGNTSRAPTGPPCPSLGLKPADWLAALSWPTLVKGALPIPANTYYKNNLPQAGTRFNATAGLNSAFSCSNTGVVSFNTGTTLQPATMLQILSSASTNANMVFGRETIVAILNSMRPATTYPITTAQVVAMFNAVYNGGVYQVNSTTQWNQAAVLAYFQSLHA